AADAGVFGGLEDVEGAGDVDVVVEGRLFDGAGDGAQGGEVEDDVAAGGGFLAVVGVADVAVEDFGGGRGFEVFFGAVGEVVEDADICAGVEEGAHEVAADEASAAGDEDG